ncbi:MAG: redoxin domain-containing protein [Caldiserica bacterium]|jgi:peroxiredoxin|nr:redoxin domain-containing protein [Caldisericota bacterium]MDH7561959.1 redoxin domain-containing protein [Caldisericota bacterium]
MEPIKVGERGALFSLKDQEGNLLQLSSLSGRKVLLSFHPLAWTRVCSDQMLSLEANWEKFQRLNALPLGISVDPVPSKRAWAESLGISKLRLLSDFWPHGEIASAYGLFRDAQGTSERANVILNEQGVVIWVKVYPISQLPPIEEIFSFLVAEGEK